MPIYYDNLCREFTDQMKIYSPPERYYEVLCGTDIFVETWRCTNNEEASIAYTEEQAEDGQIDQLRLEMLEKHNTQLNYLISHTVPADAYAQIKELVERGKEK